MTDYEICACIDNLRKCNDDYTKRLLMQIIINNITEVHSLKYETKYRLLYYLSSLRRSTISILWLFMKYKYDMIRLIDKLLIFTYDEFILI